MWRARLTSCSTRSSGFFSNSRALATISRTTCAPRSRRCGPSSNAALRPVPATSCAPRRKALSATWTTGLVQPQQGPSEGELVLPGNVSAFYAGSIYGRVSGYVKDWYDDIGAHVKKGQVLAVIDSPD